MRTTSHSRIAIAAAALWVGSSAMADALYLAGAEAARDANYVYAGRIASIGHDQLQNGWATRLWVDQSTYRYDANDVRYRGRFGRNVADAQARCAAGKAPVGEQGACFAQAFGF